MPEVIVLLSLGLGAVLVLMALLYGKSELGGTTLQEQSYLAHIDGDSGVSSLSFEFTKNKSVLPLEYALRITGVYGFGLGALGGLCAALFGVNLTLFHHTNAASTVIWTFGWLVAVAIIWAIVFLTERHTIRKMISNSSFDRSMEMGIDPVRLAGEVYLRSRSFWTWSLLAAWVGVAIASPLTASGPAIALVILKTMEKRSKSRGAIARIAKPRDLHNQLLSAGSYLMDGGWVTPAGMLLLMASLALAHFGRGEMAALCMLIIGFIGLIMWAEHASRSRSEKQSLEDWRRVLRQELNAPSEQAVLEPTV